MIIIRLVAFPFYLIVLLLVAIFLTAACGVLWLASGSPYAMNLNYPRWR